MEYNNIEDSVKINDDKGAYIFKDNDNDINLFLYIKHEPENLKNLLRLTYNENLIDSNYFIVIIKKNKDHIGQNSLKSIKNLIINKNMLNIFDKDFNLLSKKLENLTYEQYTNYLGFAKEQLFEE